MSIPYFYEPDFLPEAPALSDSNQHHLLSVLRMRPGQQLYITNGKGDRYLVSIKEVSKKNCSIDLIETQHLEKRKTNLQVAIAFTKNPSRIEWFLEKATEMGIDTIIPLVTERSEKIFFKKERFEKIIISAMLQSQQCHLPVLSTSTGLSELLELEAEQKFIAYCGEEMEKKNVIAVLKPGVNALFLIGPEGDFTPDEVHLCVQKNCGTVTLGDNRLRTETAGLFVCVLFNAIQ